MNQCKDCIFWNRSNYYTEDNRVGECRHWKISEDGDMLSLDISCGSDSEAGYNLEAIITHETFGCILFE